MMKINPRWLVFILVFAVLAISIATPAPGHAQVPECPPGFYWDRMSGVGCMQTGCLDVGNSKYSYTGTCICLDGYKGCYEPVDSSGVACSPFCPVSRLVACVAPDAACPGVNQPPVGAAPADPGGTDSPDSLSGLLRTLEELLAGEEAHSPTVGRAALGALTATLLMAVWVFVNLFSSPAVPAGPGALPSDQVVPPSEITEIYNQGPDNFRQCQDMVYARLWKQPPPHNKGQDKAMIFEKMKEEGYWQAEQGGMYDHQGVQQKLSQLKDGDIIMFGAQGMPDEQGANHYAVVANGKIHEILNLPQGGEMHVFDAKDAHKYFGERTYRSANDGKTYSMKPYYGFRVFRK